ncbi:2-haloacid dehalogenase [Geosmithia morbida]|uniref:2-haloacid dehalogenase n=1 Tax=Geosmithia morbida TaxID=1094350 RepID=A0A9P4Z229_9HYPO|nr:2-haloacid dehalogenase [Geosmithia morbida]KAF4126265.1 2-haloacid dehalogenase [Geosmithia morbida]
MSPGRLSPLADVKALAFDVFGTVVDWRSSVTDELCVRAHRKLTRSSSSSETPLPASAKSRLESVGEDGWGRFAQEWRDSYGRFTRGFDPSTDPWKTIDEHHHDSLVSLLAGWGLADLYTPSETESLSLVWHRLRPWADSAPGLDALARCRGGDEALTLSTLSNGNTSLLNDLADFGDLPFHRILSAETFRAYKPDPAVYLGAARELGLRPGQVAMVAAHLNDLEAARGCGLRTVYVERPQEEAWSEDDERYRDARGWVDLWVGEGEGGFEELARRLSRGG